MFKPQHWQLLGLWWLVLPTVTQAADLLSGELMVISSDNIYGAGKTEPPYFGSATLEFPNNLTGGGTLPKVLRLPANAQEIVFPNISGEVQCCSGATQNNADGGTFGLGKTQLNELDGLSGIRLDKTMFLVGVFLSEQISATAPATLDFNDMTGFDRLNPALQQVFFIGDGKNTQNVPQHFNIPQGATRLFLGFADGNEQGQVGFYNDNLGLLNVNYQVFGESTTVFQPPPTLDEGLLAYYTFEDAPEYNDGTTTFIGNALDRSGFNFHAQLFAGTTETGASGVQFTTQPIKYGKSVTFYSGELSLGRFAPLTRGNWSLATWFYHTPPRQNYSIVQKRRITSAEMCSLSPLYIQQGELGFWACHSDSATSFPQSVFVGTGFIINQLNEGWHHLAAISNGTTTDYFVDGRKVGHVAEGTTHGYVFLGGDSGLTLDDFRIYNRRLSAREVAILAEQPENVEDSCVAHYQWTGLLTIPCLSVADSLSVYRLELQADIPTAPTALRLLNITEKQ